MFMFLKLHSKTKSLKKKAPNCPAHRTNGKKQHANMDANMDASMDASMDVAITLVGHAGVLNRGCGGQLWHGVTV